MCVGRAQNPTRTIRLKGHAGGKKSLINMCIEEEEEEEVIHTIG